MDEQTKRNIENTPPAFYLAFKIHSITAQLCELYEKAIAYNKLMANKMKLPKEDESWQFIEEPYEYYLNNHNNTGKCEDHLLQHKDSAD